ncbi:MAG: PilZ domain-containing protein [Deltaproteobacteria bacterium]|nr:PilZ domain-containing protein [Deltaproteobacteria bacterium]
MTDLENNLRKFKRRHLIYYMEVFDDESGKLLGHLADINVNGLQLVSREAVELDRDFRLRLMLPEDVSGTAKVVFDAKSVWCRPDVNPDFFATGFSAPELDQNIRRIFMIMINQLGFND